MQSGERVRTKPDQKVTGPPAVLGVGSPSGQATKVMVSWASSTRRCPSGNGPYARPAVVLTSRGSCTVTTCPTFTRRGYFWPPNDRAVSAEVSRLPPTRTSGPTTRLLGSVKAGPNSAQDCTEQSTIAPVG